MTTAIVGQQAFDCHQKLLEAKFRAGADMLELGSALLEISTNKYFQVLGYDTFSMYLASEDVSIKERQAYSYMRIVKIFLERFAVDKKLLGEIGESKLLIIAPFLDEGNKDDLLNKAKSLPRPSLEEEMGKKGRKKDYVEDEVKIGRLSDYLANDLFPKYEHVSDLIDDSLNVATKIIKHL